MAVRFFAPSPIGLPMSNRSIIYIDGFNLYYGCLRASGLKWLDLERMFTRLRPHDDIQSIQYFTAMIDGPRRANQSRYLQALMTSSKIQITLGKFKTKQARCRVRKCEFAGSRMFDKPEEKRTDVNIALAMVDDAHHDRADRLVLVSGDSDLVPAVHLIKANSPEKQVIVYVPSRDPARGAATELRSSADKDRTLPLRLLRISQYPVEIPDGRGGVIAKPPNW